MANYKESAVAGTKWQRASRVVIDNPYGGTPGVLLVEQQAMQLGDEVVIKDIGNLAATFDPAAEIPLVNPETGESLGQVMTHQQLYVALHSLYIQLAAERDAAQAPQE